MPARPRRTASARVPAARARPPDRRREGGGEGAQLLDRRLPEGGHARSGRRRGAELDMAVGQHGPRGVGPDRGARPGLG
jgi:hypothetical protein